MALDPDLPISFKHIMSHTFPGFFSALTLFMLIDILSPMELASFASGTISGLVSFIGLVLIIGTILGIILDGIHHNVIEDMVFDNLDGYKRTKYVKYQWMKHCGGLLPIDECKHLAASCSDNCDQIEDNTCPISRNGLTRHYSFKTIEGKLSEINNFFVDDYYSYSEFYSNTFLSLVLFSWISPWFLLETFEITWEWSAWFGVISFAIAWICLYCSYSSYKAYANVVNSVMFSYLSEKKETKESKGKLSIDVNGSLTANVKGGIQ